MEAGALAAIPESVSKTQQTAKGISIRAKVGEEGGGLGRRETIDYLLRQGLVHKKWILRGSGGRVEATILAEGEVPA
jgi:hypothetical protein